MAGTPIDWGDTLVLNRVLEAALHASSDGILVVDEGGTIRFANQAATRRFGYRDLAGQELEVLIAPRDRDAHARRFADFVSRPSHRPMGRGVRLRGVRQDGSELEVSVALGHAQVRGAFVAHAAIRFLDEDE